MIFVDTRYCKGCGICVRFCSKDVLEMSDQVNNLGYFMPRIVDEHLCEDCRQCELYCPDFAIFVAEEEEGGDG